MRICLIMEGSYPYVRGGVSSWTHDMISAMKEHEFILWVIGASQESRGKFRYPLPANVVEVKEVFLDEASNLKTWRNRTFQLMPAEWEQVRKLIMTKNPEWPVLFESLRRDGRNPADLLASSRFLDLLKELCLDHYAFSPFSSLFYTMFSMFLPLLYLIGTSIPKADVYHSTAAGYAGVLGAMGAWRYRKPFLLTEHGIYTREREEEILRSKWVDPDFRDLWISYFHMLTHCAYDSASRVTSLFAQASATQVDLGCPEQKCMVIRNGVRTQAFEKIPLKEPNEFIDIGAIVRVVPIKDIKTMIYAFAGLKQQIPHTRLHILGDLSDTEYYGECRALVRQLNVDNVLFVGETNVAEYLKKLDFTVLSSISEGQPLAVIESMAAKRPCIVTNVGSCRELVEGGAGDTLGASGLCVPPMHRNALTTAMSHLATSADARLAMGFTGHQRVMRYYRHQDMITNYNKLYQEVALNGGDRV